MGQLSCLRRPAGPKCLSHANLPIMQVELRKPGTKKLPLGWRHPSFPNPLKSLNFRVIRRSAWFFAGFCVLGKPKSHRETARMVTTHTGHNGFETSRCYYGALASTTATAAKTSVLKWIPFCRSGKEMYTAKSMMHMQSCCFANLYLLLFGLACVAGGILAFPLIPPATQAIFGHSRCRRRRRCLRFLSFSCC